MDIRETHYSSFDVDEELGIYVTVDRRGERRVLLDISGRYGWCKVSVDIDTAKRLVRDVKHILYLIDPVESASVREIIEEMRRESGSDDVAR